MSDSFPSLSTDLTEHILSHLPIPSLLRASAVSKSWLSLITSPTFPPHRNHHSPWFFLHGLHNTSSKNHQSFAFDPLSLSWYRLPVSFPFLSPDFTASNGFLFSTAPSFYFSRVFSRRWTSTSPLRFSRINPLVGVFGNPEKFIVAGGVRFLGGLVDIEDRLAVEIYDPAFDTWHLCPPLPANFRSGYSSQTLSSALFNGKFFVFGIYSFSISSFDLENHVWSEVKTLRPPGIMFAFLVACDDMLVLAGMCSGPSFVLWKIDPTSMDFSEIALMPRDLLYGLVDIEEDDKFASLKCIGMGNLIYVFNEEYHKKYPACVCEIRNNGDQFTWRKVPPLPSSVNKFHKVISFCSLVLPCDVFRDRIHEAPGCMF